MTARPIRRAFVTIRYWALVLAPLLPAALPAQVLRDSVITVNATRSVRLAPDRATLFVTIEGTAETSRDALAVSETKLAVVLRALRGLGDGIELGTPIAFSVAPTSSGRGFAGPQAVTLLTARTAVRVHVKRLSDLARTFAAAADAGAAGTSALTFESSLADSVRRAEVAVALVTARQEASAIATALDGRLGGVVDISTSSNDRMFTQPAMLAIDGMMGQPTLAPEVLVSVSVTARFRLVR